MPMTFLRNAIILFYFLAPGLAAAQQLLQSPDEAMDNGDRLAQVIGQVGEYTACLIEQKDGIAVLWYDSLMNKAGTSEINFLGRGGAPFSFYNGKEAVFVFYQNKNQKKIELWGAKILPVNKDTIVPQILDSAMLAGSWDKSHFTTFAPEGKNKFIYTYVSAARNNSVSGLNLAILDDNLRIEQTHTEPLPQENGKQVLDVHLSDVDDLYILMGDGNHDEKLYTKLWMGVWPYGDPVLRFESMNLSERVMASPYLAVNTISNSLVVGGMMYNSSGAQLQGLAAYTFDLPTNRWSQTALTALSASALNAPGLDLNDLRLRTFSLKEDGGFTYVMEKSFKQIFRQNNNVGIMMPSMSMGSSSYTIYHDDELYALDANAKGTIQWNKIIMKSQETSEVNGRYQSFGTLRTSLGNVFLFLDKPRGQERFLTAFLSNEGLLTLRQFNPSNYTNIESDGILMKASKQVSANEVVFPIVKRGTLSFAKIVF